MTRYSALLAALVCLLFGTLALAYESNIGIVTSTGTSVQSAFSFPSGDLMVQCDSAAYVKAGKSPVTATTTSVHLDAWEKYPIYRDNGAPVDALAVLSASGTSNCEVFKSFSLPGRR